MTKKGLIKWIANHIIGSGGMAYQHEIVLEMLNFPEWKGMPPASVQGTVGRVLTNKDIFYKERAGKTYKVTLVHGWFSVWEGLTERGIDPPKRKQIRIEKQEAIQRADDETFLAVKGIAEKRASVDYREVERSAAAITAYALMEIANCLRKLTDDKKKAPE